MGQGSIGGVQGLPGGEGAQPGTLHSPERHRGVACWTAPPESNGWTDGWRGDASCSDITFGPLLPVRPTIP